jgi:hypothetical protein
MDVHLLQTFFYHRIQPLHQQVTKLWLYPRPSCLEPSFSKELREMEINTRMHKVPDHGANMNPGASPTPLGEGSPAPWLVYLDLFRQFA